MNPIHFRFITRPPTLESYNIAQLLLLLDDFNVRDRDVILRPAYLCITFSDHGLSAETRQEQMYQEFRAAFSENSLQDSDEDTVRYRDACLVYGLVCYLLVEAERHCTLGAYETFRVHNHDHLKQFEDALEGDEGSRQRAMEWSIKAIKQLDRVYGNRFMSLLAYRRFCDEIVEPLLTEPETDAQ